jgi:hypothetical protein
MEVSEEPPTFLSPCDLLSVLLAARYLSIGFLFLTAPEGKVTGMREILPWAKAVVDNCNSNCNCKRLLRRRTDR